MRYRRKNYRMYKYIISRRRPKRSRFDNLQRGSEYSPLQSPLLPNRT